MIKDFCGLIELFLLLRKLKAEGFVVSFFSIRCTLLHRLKITSNSPITSENVPSFNLEEERAFNLNISISSNPEKNSVLNNPIGSPTIYEGDFKMNDNKKYLNDLKQELNRYKKKLSTAEGFFRGKASKEGNNIIKSLKEILKEATQDYKKLETASAEEWEPLKRIASQSFEDLKEAFEDLLDTTSDQVNKYANQVEEYSKEALESSVQYIKSNPFTSILLAGGLGFIIRGILK